MYCLPFVKEDDYFDDSDDENQNAAPQNSTDIVFLEVLTYLNDNDTSLQMLHRYPIMKKVFLKYNTALISSAPVETFLLWVHYFTRTKRKLNR